MNKTQARALLNRQLRDMPKRMRMDAKLQILDVRATAFGVRAKVDLRDTEELQWEALVKFWKAYCLRNGVVPEFTTEEIMGYINHGRWVANCPNCNNGIECAPVFPFGLCLGCGNAYTVVFPTEAKRTRAEAALVVRPHENRNWFPDREEPADLELENEAHAGEIGLSNGVDNS